MNLFTSTRSRGSRLGSMENCSTWNAWATETMMKCASRNAITRVLPNSMAVLRISFQLIPVLASSGGGNGYDLHPPPSPLSPILACNDSTAICGCFRGAPCPPAAGAYLPGARPSPSPCQYGVNARHPLPIPDEIGPQSDDSGSSVLVGPYR